MDHSGDIACELGQAWADQHLGSVTEPRGDRERQSFIIQNREGIWFRVTVDQIAYTDLTEEEDYRPQIVSGVA